MYPQGQQVVQMGLVQPDQGYCSAQIQDMQSPNSAGGVYVYNNNTAASPNQGYSSNMVNDVQSQGNENANLQQTPN